MQTCATLLLSALKHVIDEAGFAGPYRRGNTDRPADLSDRLHRFRIDDLQIFDPKRRLAAQDSEGSLPGLARTGARR